MHSKLYHIRFDSLADAQAAAKQLSGVTGVVVVGVSQSHSHGPDILVLSLAEGVTVEELMDKAPALKESADVMAVEYSDILPDEASTGRIVPVMDGEDDGSENL